MEATSLQASLVRPQLSPTRFRFQLYTQIWRKGQFWPRIVKTRSVPDAVKSEKAKGSLGKQQEENPYREKGAFVLDFLELLMILN